MANRSIALNKKELNERMTPGANDTRMSEFSHSIEIGFGRFLYI